MSDCLSISVTPWDKLWRRVIMRFWTKLGLWALIYPAMEIDLPGEESLVIPRAKDCVDERDLMKLYGNNTRNRAIYAVTAKKDELKTKFNGASAADVTEGSAASAKQNRYASNWGSGKFSLHMKRGRKTVNQDAMIVHEKFASEEDVMFCGVFDGHGPDGHNVARNVRDILPQKLAASWKSQQLAERGMSLSSDDSEQESDTQEVTDYDGDLLGDPSAIMAWKESFLAAYKTTDRELLINGFVDCVSSGTTAVTLVKQGNDLIVGNVGDSRAVLGTRMDDDTIIALPLTVDMKPDIPREAERIRSRKGRVFPLRREPLVQRIWLPQQNIPGLAMSRALGDFCLKNHGVISEPEVTYRRLTKRDEFVVLATDGVWDVLTNEQVIEMVASASDKSRVARTIVERAAHAWRSKYAASCADDCAVVCLFL